MDSKLINKTNILGIFLISICVVLLNQYSALLLIFLVGVFIIVRYKHKAAYLIIIVSFLTVTSTISISLRAIVQALGIGVLLFLFFKENGLKLRNYPSIPPEVLKLIILLLISMVLSILFSKYKMTGVDQLVRLIIFLLVVYVLYSSLYKYVTVNHYIWALIITCLIYIVVTFYGFYETGFSLIEINLNQLNKPQEDYINSNSIGSFMVLVFLILMPFTIAELKLRYKKYVVILLLLILSTLVVVNSRAAILALAISSGYLLFKLNKKLLFIILAAIIILIPFAFVEPFSNYINLYFRLERLSTGRDNILTTVYYVIKEHLLFGTGPAGTKYEMFKNIPYMLGSPEELYIYHHVNMIEFGHAHNFYLFLLSDLGIMGLIVSVLLPVVYFHINNKVIDIYKEKNFNLYLLSLGIKAAGIAFFFRGLFEWGNILSYGTLGSDLPFWILFMIIVYLYQAKELMTNEIFIIH